MSAYYNEIDPQAAQWLRNLIAEGVIAPGAVDERDVRDVKPVELLGYSQCHFFAGIGVWSYALRLAGWPDDRPVWTGSCPCQPFSAAGKGEGFADERHVWPSWHHLIRCSHPAVVFGEQVSSPDGLGWFDLVHLDLEGESYAVRALDSCSAGVGAPHLRQRLWFMAYAASLGSGARLRDSGTGCVGWGEPGDDRATCILDYTFGNGRAAWRNDHTGDVRVESSASIFTGFMGDAQGQRLAQCGERSSVARESSLKRSRQRLERPGCDQPLADSTRPGQPEFGRRGITSAEDARPHAHVDHQEHWPKPTNGFWRAADWLGCRDGKFRPVEPGTFPLAHGVAGRVGLLRGFGNAINPWNAAAMIAAGMAELEAV